MLSDYVGIVSGLCRYCVGDYVGIVSVLCRYCVGIVSVLCRYCVGILSDTMSDCPGHVFYLATNKHLKYETQGEVVSLA